MLTSALKARPSWPSPCLPIQGACKMRVGTHYTPTRDGQERQHQVQSKRSRRQAVGLAALGKGSSSDTRNYSEQPKGQSPVCQKFEDLQIWSSCPTGAGESGVRWEPKVHLDNNPDHHCMVHGCPSPKLPLHPQLCHHAHILSMS